MSSIYDSPDIASARSNAAKTGAAASAAETAGMNLPDMLKQALVTKFSQNNPLYANRETALNNYMDEGNKAPTRVTAPSAGGTAPAVYNPSQQANLIQGYRNSQLAPLTTANSLLGLATGGMGDVIDSASRSYGAYTKGQTDKAKLAQDAFENLLKEAQLRSDESYKTASLASKAKKSGSGLTSNQLFSILDKIGAIQGSLGDVQSLKGMSGTAGASNFNPFGIRNILPSNFGGLSPEQRRFASSSAQANSRLFQTAGKSFTGPERSLLESLVFSPTNSAESFTSTANQAESTLNTQLNSYLRNLMALGYDPNELGVDGGFGGGSEDDFQPY